MPIKITAQAVSKLKPRSTKFIEYDTGGEGVRREGRAERAQVLHPDLPHQDRHAEAHHHRSAILNGRWQQRARKPRSCASASPAARIPWLTGRTPATAPTVADLAEDYIERHLPTKRPSSREDDMRMIRVHVLPALAQRQGCRCRSQDHRSSAQQDHQARHADQGERGEAAAVEDVLALHPLGIPHRQSVRRGGDEPGAEPREVPVAGRGSSTDEGAARSDSDRESATAIMLALLTGARRGELLKATWDQFDLEAWRLGQAVDRIRSRSGSTACHWRRTRMSCWSAWRQDDAARNAGIPHQSQAGHPCAVGAHPRASRSGRCSGSTICATATHRCW